MDRLDSISVTLSGRFSGIPAVLQTADMPWAARASAWELTVGRQAKLHPEGRGGGPGQFAVPMNADDSAFKPSTRRVGDWRRMTLVQAL